MDMNENYEPEPLDIDHDKLIASIIDRNMEDSERASSAGESRQLIGEFLGETGMNSQAYSWMRTILKKKKYSQRMDIIRSLEEALPMIKAHVMGQGFGPDLVDQAQDYADPDDDKVDDSDRDADSDPELDAEQDEFEAEVDKVVPFGEAAE